MAKIALFVIAAFCIVQLSLAARVDREVETTTVSIQDTAQKAFESIQKTFESTFTKENLDKFVDTASKTFNEVKNTAEGYLKDFQSTAKPDAEKKN